VDYGRVTKSGWGKDPHDNVIKSEVGFKIFVGFNIFHALAIE